MIPSIAVIEAEVTNFTNVQSAVCWLTDELH